MGKVSVRGIVLREYDSSETDKKLVLLTKDTGKISVSARGAKSIKSRFHSSAQTFCYSDFMLYRGSNFYAVTQAEPITNFSMYYTSLDKLLYGTYFLELIDKTLMNGQEANNIMLLLLKSLSKLRNAHPKKISAVFQLRLLDLLGFGLNPETCANCGDKLDNLYFSPHMGFICMQCEGAKSRVSPAIRNTIIYITKNDLDRCFMFNITSELLEELGNIAENTFKYQLEVNTNSLLLLNS